MDKREQILARLVTVAQGLPGVSTVTRNSDEISEHKRPAIAIFDADETADERAEQQGHPGQAPNLIEMTPEVLICQSALERDPLSASKRDPFERRVLAVALALSELVGVAETARARVV